MRVKKIVEQINPLFVIIIFATLFSVNCTEGKIVIGDTMSNINEYKIRIILNDKIIEATLENNPTSKDFVSLLPMNVELNDYAGTEKITYLSRKLSTENAPNGVTPSIGDITYYAPWGNLAIFYRDFGYSSGLIKLGKITKGIEELNLSSSLKVKIELIK